MQALRTRVQIKASDSLRLDQAIAKITTQSGAIVEVKIEHATGTVANPISDKDLEKKFLGNAEPVLGATQAAVVAKQIWALDQLADVGDLVRLCG